MSMEDRPLRLFIASPLHRPAAELCHSQARDIARSFSRIRLMKKESYHITLAFLGDIPRSQIPSIKEAMDLCALKITPFRLEGLGKIPGSKGDLLYRPCILPEGYLRLQAFLEGELRRRGFKLEDRPFRPHVTIARGAVLSQGKSLGQLSQALPPVEGRLNAICLYSSHLSPQGASYEALYQIRGKGRW